jgi:outer membrane receptor protein involved in Fe transport
MPQCTPANLAISEAGGPDCVEAVGPVPGYFSSDPSLRTGTNTAFGENDERGYTQLAFFGSFDFDIIPKVLTVTYGIRHFHYDEWEQGSEYYSATSSILNVANGTPYGAGGGAAYGFGMNLHKSESGSRQRANLTWHVTPDLMAYYTYSQGFRPGGFNRTGTNESGSMISLKAVAPYCVYTGANPLCKNSDQYLKPVGYSSDDLINNEIGFKSEFLNHRVQFNVSAYDMVWSSIQLPLFDPSQLGNTTFDVNGPTYKVNGIELQLVAKVMQGLTIQGSSSWNSTNQTDAPCLRSSGTVGSSHLANNPTPKGECITQINGQPFTNPYGVLDTTPAYSPPLEFNVRARYEVAFDSYKSFVSFGANYIAAERNEPASFPSGELSPPSGCLVNGVPNTTLCKYTMPGYTTTDASIGVSKDSWTTQIVANNLSNSDASTNTSSGQFLKSEVPLRPRVITFQFGYKF